MRFCDSRDSEREGRSAPRRGCRDIMLRALYAFEDEESLAGIAGRKRLLPGIRRIRKKISWEGRGVVGGCGEVSGDMSSVLDMPKVLSSIQTR